MSTLSWYCFFFDVAMLLSVMASDELHVLDANSMTIPVFPMFNAERATLMVDSVSLADSVLSFCDETGLVFTIETYNVVYRVV